MADIALLDQVPAQPSREALGDRLQGIVGRLAAEATKRMADRLPTEKRWIDDLQQYWGQYDEETKKKLIAGENSKLFINETRPKTNAMSARLIDILFPTDDKNWGIYPTPVPELTEAAKQAAAAARQIAQQAKDAAEQVEAAQNPDQEQMQRARMLEQQSQDASRKAADLQSQIDEARRRSDLMSKEIDDQLKESLYHAVMRDVVESACKVGTGVCKGPVTGDQVRKGWKPQPVAGPDGQPMAGPGGQAAMQYRLQMSSGTQPAFRYVDIWSFFPSIDARNIEESEGVFERHLHNQKGLRKLSRLKGFSKDAIRRLLATKPTMSAPSYMIDLRNLYGEYANSVPTGEYYHVWEYSGPLSAEDMHDLAIAMGDKGAIEDLGDVVDPLTEINAIVWFCQDEVLKFSIYPYDSGECMYSVFNLEKDESSIFGYGMPAIIRDPQKSLNAAWRMMMDNAGLASGPQIVVSTRHINPADGDWTLRPRKIWQTTEALPQNGRAFESFNIDMHQAEIANIIAISKQFIDDMSSMPMIAQGEQGTGVTRTAQGMTLLMNSTNVVFRRIVKNFDDDMTTPNIRRGYDWNMQFSTKEEIKGDYSVDARGSSVLLVREMQAQNLFLIALQLGAHPVYGPMLKNRDVLRKLFQAHMIPADEVVLSDDEIDAVMASAAAEQAAMAADQGAAELENQKIEMQIELANMERDTQITVAKLNRDTAMIQLAEKMNMQLDQLDAKLLMNREQLQSRERLFASEVAVEQRSAAAARAAGTEPQGSGGYVSAQ